MPRPVRDADANKKEAVGLITGGLFCVHSSVRHSLGPREPSDNKKTLSHCGYWCELRHMCHFGTVRHAHTVMCPADLEKPSRSAGCWLSPVVQKRKSPPRGRANFRLRL